jgi:hypothetical protein
VTRFSRRPSSTARWCERHLLPKARSVLLDSGHFVWEDQAGHYAAVILNSIPGSYRAA